MNHLLSLFSGLVFGIGFILGGMTDPLKVKAFLDVAAAWDPSLALVMGGAIVVGIGAFALARGRERAWTRAHMELPTNRTIDTRLIVGGSSYWRGVCDGRANATSPAPLPPGASTPPSAATSKCARR